MDCLEQQKTFWRFKASEKWARVCVLALVICMQIALFLCCIVLLPVAYLAVPYFPIWFKKMAWYLGKKLLNITCVFWISLQFLCETFRTPRGIQWHFVLKIWVYVEYMLFFPNFNGTWIFWRYFPRILKYHILWKSAHWEPSCFMQTDGRKDMTRLTVAFSSYANAPKNYLCVQYVCPLVPGIQLLECYLKQ